MNYKKLLKQYPEVAQDLKSNNIEWTENGLQNDYTTNNLTVRIKVNFNKKAKSFVKQMTQRTNSIFKKQQFLDNFIQECLAHYQLLDKDIIQAVLNEKDMSETNAEDYACVIRKRLDEESLKYETEYFSNISDYPDIFYKARKRKRKIIAYLGETNSGKTYNAMSQLADSFKGAYLAPLRLLAYENYNYLNSQGIETNLITGEEKLINSKTPQCTSSTIECFNSENHYDTVVIDEVQLIDDRDRGPFFVQALIGADAENVIVTGPPDYEDRLRHIAHDLGEEIEVHHFQRKSKIKPVKKPYNFNNIPSNSAIVVFSRKDVFRVRQELPKNYKVSMIYGALGHEVRKSQAEKFINGDTDVLIATDAIGMGMNLPIENIIFYNFKKYDGYAFNVLGDMLTKQICGRCGRYGIYDVGYYGALDNETLKYITQTMKHQLDVPNKKLNVIPTQHYIETLLEKYSLSSILKDWSENEKFPEKGLYKNSKLNNKIKIAEFLENKYPEMVKSHYNLVNCPVDYEKNTTIFNSLVKQMFEEGKIHLPNDNDVNSSMALSDLETFVKHATIMLWFSNQFPEYCENSYESYQSAVKSLIEEANERIDNMLTKSNIKKK
ncbi:hypothetical protein PBI_SCTP2_83 [Salicola phage SCTP-2]|nr:hypothetical protein PBI_SCTP2_83 [Salicola phage SCTP-2]